jgi:pentose-5-phosphate-3-epimerase
MGFFYLWFILLFYVNVWVDLSRLNGRVENLNNSERLWIYLDIKNVKYIYNIILFMNFLIIIKKLNVLFILIFTQNKHQ